MIIREATREDSKWIYHHRIRMFTDMGLSGDYIQGTAELTSEYLEEDWMKHYRYFLVEVDGEVVGGCGISTFRIPPQVSQPKGLYTYLSNMYVEKPHRGRGIGRAMLDYVLEVCRKEGIGLMFLHGSDEGIPLYASMGFESSKRLMGLRIE